MTVLHFPLTRLSESNHFSLVDLDLLSAELRSQVEKYKLEKINLQQSIKTLSSQEETLKDRTSGPERRKSPRRLYDLLRDKKSSYYLTKTRLAAEVIQLLKIRSERKIFSLRSHLNDMIVVQ